MLQMKETYQQWAKTEPANREGQSDQNGEIIQAGAKRKKGKSERLSAKWWWVRVTTILCSCANRHRSIRLK